MPTERPGYRFRQMVNQMENGRINVEVNLPPVSRTGISPFLYSTRSGKSI